MTVKLKCKTCKGVIVRSELHPDGRWVHEDDTIVLSTLKGIVSAGEYDHEAEPDVIDVGTPSVKAEPPTSGSPFGVIRPGT